MPKKPTTTDKFMNEVILYGSLPMTRANVHRQALDDTGDAKAADMFAFGGQAKLAPPGTEPVSQAEFQRAFAAAGTGECSADEGREERIRNIMKAGKALGVTAAEAREIDTYLWDMYGDRLAMLDESAVAAYLRAIRSSGRVGVSKRCAAGKSKRRAGRGNSKPGIGMGSIRQ